LENGGWREVVRMSWEGKKETGWREGAMFGKSTFNITIIMD
jgi:hypothetical protein